ncbi:MAG: JAB domain-containing protein [Flavobacteriales bacterium]|nr:JAB domain-containing protein [Flavobacteriales bacterium]
MNINLSSEEKIKVLNGDDLYGIMQRILLRADKIDQDREHFWIVGLATNNRILFIELIGLGSVNATIAEPMDVFSFALQKRAVKIILVHNHPSGELKPSPADLDMTDRLIQVGVIVNTEVYDHLIITKRSYMSFRDTSVLDELKESKKYVVPTMPLDDRLKLKAEQLAEKNAVFVKSEIALKLLGKGVDLETIRETTGLSTEEIQQLRSEN